MTNKRLVQRRGDGWEVRKPGGTRSSDIVRTHADGIRRTGTIPSNTAGGEMHVRSGNGTGDGGVDKCLGNGHENSHAHNEFERDRPAGLGQVGNVATLP